MKQNFRDGLTHLGIALSSFSLIQTKIFIGWTFLDYVISNSDFLFSWIN